MMFWPSTAGILRKGTSNEMVGEWFFVRYADPDDHLRVRFRGVPERLWQATLCHCCRSWASSLVTDDCAVDLVLKHMNGNWSGTADRKVWPYRKVSSPPTAGPPYRFFSCKRQGTKLNKMLLSALSTDDLLCALGSFCGSSHQGLRALAPDHEGGDAFRKHKMFLRQRIRGTEMPAALARNPTVSSLFEKRRDDIIPLGSRLTNLARSGRLTREISDIYATFVHLHLNRLLGAMPTDERRFAECSDDYSTDWRYTQAEAGRHHNSNNNREPASTMNKRFGEGLRPMR